MTRKLYAVTLVFAAMFGTSVASVGVFNLTTDWSDFNNPMGQWALYKNPTTLFTINQADYWSDGTNYRVWADSPYPQHYHVPFWSRMDAAHASAEIPTGTIFMHGSDPNRTGTDYTAAFLTIPEAGVATVSGDAWMPYKSLNRGVHWLILHNGVLMTEGRLAYNDAYVAASPMSFAMGSGGPVALTVPVLTGDRIELRILPNYQTPDTLPWMAGLHINVNVAPDPANQNLTGTLFLGDTGGSFAFNRSIAYSVKQGTSTVASGTVTASASSTPLNISVPATVTGASQLILDGSSFLKRVINVNLTGSNQTVGSATMQNGDVDNSGEVDAADIDQVIAAFGQLTNIPSDVDVSGEVDAADIDIVIANFGGLDQ